MCVSPSHPLVSDSSIEIKSIDFKNEKFDRSKNEVHGKRKRKILVRFIMYSKTSIICYLVCSRSLK